MILQHMRAPMLEFVRQLERRAHDQSQPLLPGYPHPHWGTMAIHGESVGRQLILYRVNAWLEIARIWKEEAARI
jgi:hypothetical protein